MPFIYLAIAFILNAAGTILFKMEARRGIDMSGSIYHIIANNYLMVTGFVLFAINAVFYIIALRTLPLAIAYPVMTIMSLIIVTAASIIIFNEHINGIQIIGYVLLVTAIILIFCFGK